MVLVGLVGLAVLVGLVGLVCLMGLVFFVIISWSALGAFVRVKAHIMDDVDDSNTDFHTPMQLCYHIGLVISTDIIKAM